MSTLTVANVERQVCGLIGRLMSLVGLAGGTFNGSNPDLQAPIRDGFERMGYAISDPAGLAIVDADLMAFDNRALRRLMEWTSIYALEQVQRDWWRAKANRAPGMDIKVVNGVVTDPLDEPRSMVRDLLRALRAEG